MEQELISGTVAAVVFENRENGYSVIKLDSEDGSLITVVGTIPLPVAVRTGKKETGQIAYHPREPCDIIKLFGSFSCEYCERIETTTRFGQSRSRTEGLFVRR